MKIKRIFLLILFLILIVLLVNFAVNLNYKFKMFKEHKDYFELPNNEKQVEPWMTLRMIKKEFGIKVPQELNLEKKFYDDKKTLEEFAIENDLNLNEIILKLEDKKNISLENKGKKDKK